MRVLLLTQDHCGFCDQAHEVLDRLAAEYGFEVSTIDIDSSEGLQLAERGGVLFPPGIFLDGEPFSYGRLSERKLRRELKRRCGAGDQGALSNPQDRRREMGT
jgi:thiol-disulfide isomerase/thioredoxin